MKDTLIINIIGGPGVGKTTIASELFARLKKLHIDVENVSEFAKELVWQERNNAFNDRLYMHAIQNHRLFLMNGKLDMVITDSPLLLTSIYNHHYLENVHEKSYNDMIDSMVLETWKLYHNITYYVHRQTSYNVLGRRENLEEASQIDEMILAYLKQHDIVYKDVELDHAIDVIYQDLLKRIGK